MTFLQTLVQTLLIYVLLLAFTALVVSLGPGFHEINGQLVFLFCMVGGLPAAYRLARSFGARA